MALIIHRINTKYVDSFKDIQSVIEYIKEDSVYINSITSIQANGVELEHIYKMFSRFDNDSSLSRPAFIPKGKSPIIFGSLARIIVANLNYES